MVNTILLVFGVNRTFVKGIAKGLRIVGEKFKRGEMFLVDLVSVAEPAQEAVREMLEPEFKKNEGMKTLGQVVLGTVHGDIHSIGKIIVSSMFFAAGFQVLDLGEDVPAEQFARKAVETNAAIVGPSALLTTSIEGQKEIVDSLKSSGVRNKGEDYVRGRTMHRGMGSGNRGRRLRDKRDGSSQSGKTTA
jgi:dimethylamine corrinoid protein